MRHGPYCALGFSGHVFKMSPMIGVLMMDPNTQGQATSVYITPLNWSRFLEADPVNSRYRYRGLA